MLLFVDDGGQVAGMDMMEWRDELVPILIEMMQDSSSLAKREV
jgi:FKBP12-rapamycin complex-associated protein